MRPVLRPGLRVLRRSATTLQLGVRSDTAIVVDDSPEIRAVLRACDGVRQDAEVLTAVVASGVGRAAAARALAGLCRWEVLVDADELLEALGELPETARHRLAGDIGALSWLTGKARRNAGQSSAAVPELLHRRRRASIAVHGLGEPGAQTAWQLAAAGVGELVLVDTGMVPPAPLLPGGGAPERTRRRSAWLRAELTRVAPWTRVRFGPTTRVVDAAVLVADPAEGVGEVERAQAAGLVRGGVPHLFASVLETTGTLGPFVLPGSSACLRCVELTRSEADPARSLSQQIRSGPPAPGLPAADSTLSGLVGAWAALEVLAYVQGLPVCTAGATLEVFLGGRLPRHQRWQAHPGCGCQWGTAATMGA